MCVIYINPMWFVCITIPMDCISLSDIRELDFDAILLTQLIVGLLFHSVFRSFLIIIRATYITTLVACTYEHISRYAFMMHPGGLSWYKTPLLISSENVTLNTTGCIHVPQISVTNSM